MKIGFYYNILLLNYKKFAEKLPGIGVNEALTGHTDILSLRKKLWIFLTYGLSKPMRQTTLLKTSPEFLDNKSFFIIK